jgi:hypothetical protein
MVQLLISFPYFCCVPSSPTDHIQDFTISLYYYGVNLVKLLHKTLIVYKNQILQRRFLQLNVQMIAGSKPHDYPLSTPPSASSFALIPLSRY